MIAVSTIAWPRDADANVIEALRGGPARGIELAPTREWPDPTAATAAEVAQVRARWEDAGLPIVACQSLFFGRDDLAIFADADRRRRTAEHLDRMIDLGAQLGARRLAFGAPALRRLDGMSSAEATRVAGEFFRRAGARAARHGMEICLEPLPREYGCEFLNTTRECVDFLDALRAPGLGLLLDSAALTMNGEPLDRAFEIAQPWLGHFHISEPDLAPIGSGGVPHREIGSHLRAIGYSGWLTVEMRPPEGAPSAEAVSNALARAAADYEVATAR